MELGRRVLFLGVLLFMVAPTQINCTNPLKPGEIKTSIGREPAGWVTEAIASGYGTKKWILPELGWTGWATPHPEMHSFDTFIHFVNIYAHDIVVQGRFQGDSGVTYASFIVPAKKRVTHHIAAFGGHLTGFHSAEFYSVISNSEIYVSTTVYNRSWEGQHWEASKGVNGITQTRTNWFFGEGGSFGYGGTDVWHHFYTVYNPNDFWIRVDFQFFVDQYDRHWQRTIPNPYVESRWVAPRSRFAYNPDNNQGPWTQVGGTATKVVCSSECAAQMAMYQRPGFGRRSNTQSSNGSSPAHKWYVVGIPTGGTNAGIAGWQNRIYIFNVSDQNNYVTFTYRNAAGTAISSTSHTIPPYTRISYDLNNYNPGQPPNVGYAPQGYDGSNLSLEINGTSRIAITKIIYWARGYVWSEGNTTTGASIGSNRVVFPGGNVGGPFANYIQVMNTSDTATWVRATRLRTGAHVPTESWVYLPAKGMAQLDAHSLGYTGDFGTLLETYNGVPIVAEMSNFFDWQHAEPHMMWRSGESFEGIAIDSNGSPIEP